MQRLAVRWKPNLNRLCVGIFMSLPWCLGNGVGRFRANFLEQQLPHESDQRRIKDPRAPGSGFRSALLKSAQNYSRGG